MTTPLLVGVVYVCCAYVLGFITAIQRVDRYVIGPWFDSIPVGDSHYWLRMRDFEAAQSGFLRAEGILARDRSRPHVSFTDEPLHSDDVAVWSALAQLGIEP